MKTWPDAELPEVLSRLLLELGACCDGSSVADFQRDVLRLVRKELAFDSAFWAAGVLGPSREPIVQSVCLLDQPEAMLASYEQVKHLDTILARALAHFGTTVNVDTREEFSRPGSEPMWRHGERFGIRHVLATLTHGPISELLGAISLYLSDEARPFSDQERLLQQCLAPHLVALCNRNRMLHLEGASSTDPATLIRAAALVDREGMLYGANASFIELMREEWSDWRGPFMTPDLRAALAVARERPILFSRIAVHVQPSNDLLLLRVRRIGLGDGLSGREWDVARSFGDGLSHKEIAEVLHIAPSTVRNHLRAIYEKLGVANKAELARALAEAPR